MVSGGVIRDNGQYIREKASMDFQAVTDEMKTWTKARVMPGFSVALLTGKTVQTAVSGEAQWLSLIHI